MKNSSTPPLICFGENLWAAAQSHRLPFGTPINVARHLKAHQIESTLITKVGFDDAGRYLITLLEQEGISTEHFQLDYELATYNSSMFGAGMADRQLFETPSDHILWDADFEALFADPCFLVHTTLPLKSKISRDTLFHLIELSPERIVRMEMTHPLPDKASLLRCLQGAAIFLLTEAQLEWMTGWFSKFNSLQDRIFVLRDTFHINTIICMTNSGGIMMIADDRLYEEFVDPNILTVGSDDAFLSGIIYGELQRFSAPKTLKYAQILKQMIHSDIHYQQYEPQPLLMSISEY